MNNIRVSKRFTDAFYYNSGNDTYIQKFNVDEYSPHNSIVFAIHNQYNRWIRIYMIKFKWNLIFFKL